MTMHYLINVPHIETDTGLDFYSPHAHVSLDFPYEGGAYYSVTDHRACDLISNSRDFERFDDALDHAAMRLQMRF